MKPLLTSLTAISLLTLLMFSSSAFYHKKNVIKIVPLSTVELIIKHARFYGVSEKLLTDLAMIESNLCKDVVSKTSSARGCFQIIRSTWDRYCSGSVMSDNDNIRCAAKMIKIGGITHWLADERTRERLVALGYNF